MKLNIPKAVACWQFCNINFGIHFSVIQYFDSDVLHMQDLWEEKTEVVQFPKLSQGEVKDGVRSESYFADKTCVNRAYDHAISCHSRSNTTESK